jgi:hypothetical protein
VRTMAAAMMAYHSGTWSVESTSMNQ